MLRRLMALPLLIAAALLLLGSFLDFRYHNVIMVVSAVICGVFGVYEIFRQDLYKEDTNNN